MEEFKKAYASLNQAQKKAVDQIDGPVLVIAGPGTGKTHLLTTRVANILQKTDTLPQNILCLTYTDAAAHTMRERLTNILGQKAYDLTISTYHGFGSELIRRYQDYYFDTDQQYAINELKIDSYLRQILDSLPYDNPLKNEFFLPDIKTLISDCKRALLTPQDLVSLSKINNQFYDQIQVILDESFRDFKRIDKKSVKFFQDLLNGLTSISSKKLSKNIMSLKQLWQESLSAAIEEFDSIQKTGPLTKWKDSWLSKDSSGKFIPSDRRSSDKLRAFVDIYRQYRAVLSDERAFDYDDMISQAIVGLQKNPDLRYTLQEKYQYILLDEFQDTNGAQLRLIELLTDNPVHEGRPNILAVGDDDQAIYAFQGANYSNMNTFYEMYKDVKIITLRENYRSSADIVNLTTGIASQISERLSQRFKAASGPVVSKATPDRHQLIEREEFKSDVAQYAWVAQKVSRLIKDGTSASEIAVLAPKHKFLEPLVPYLHHAGLSVRYEKRENVLDDRLVSDLILMAKLILSLNENDFALTSSLWIEVLSADFWRLSTEEIWRLSWQADEEKTNWTKLLLQNEATKDIVLFFLALASLAAHETLETMFDYLIGVSPITIDQPTDRQMQSPIYNHYFSDKASSNNSGQFWQLLSNLTVLRQHLREFQNSDSNPLLLKDFIIFVDAHRQARINIINTSPYYESADAVQLMTAYRSKGQEFKIVFVLANLEEVWGSGAARLSSRLTLPSNLNFIRYAGSTSNEQLRLFYVALSRAKSQLYLTSYLSTYTNKPLTRLKFLSETTDGQSETISPLLPLANQKVQKLDTSAPKLATLELYWHTRHHESLDRADIRSLLAPRLQRFQLSASHINQYVDVLSDGPHSFLMATLLRFPRASKPSALYGNAIHETLQWVHAYNKDTSRLPTERKVLENFKQHLDHKYLSAKQLDLLNSRGQYSLSQYLKQRAETISANNEAEFNFRREGIFVNGAHLTGNVDKLIIDRPAKKITIVDYKTGRSHQKWTADLVLHKYKKQLYFYKFLVEGSQSFRGYEVEDAYLEFVEPDQSGDIQQLHLSFDPGEEDQLRSLIRGVWERILRLDFPDVSQFPQSLSGIKAFEEFLSGHQS